MRRKEFVPDLLRYRTSRPESVHLPIGQTRLCQVAISGGALKGSGRGTDPSNEPQNGGPAAGMREAGSLVLGGGIRGARLDSEPIVLPRKAPAHTANG